MTKHGILKLTKHAACAAIIGMSFSTASLAFGGYPVGDNGTHARLTESNALLRTTTSMITRSTTSIAELQRAVGQPGAIPSPLDDVLGQSISGGADFYQNMQQFGYDMCAVTLCQVGDAPVGSTDIEEVREWAMENFYTRGDGEGNALTREIIQDLEEIRRRSMVYAATNALSLSVTIHNELASADGIANALDEKINQSGSQREDIQTNSAILLAQYKTNLQQLAVLTSMLDVMASANINLTDAYHEEGGTEFSNAYIQEDFSDSAGSSRTTVTVPQRGR